MHYNHTRQKKGFALIVTLSLLALLAIITMAMLTLSVNEVRTSVESEAVSVARANARLSLILGIGELQKEMGPDQRISGSTAILDSSTESDVADGVRHPHWLGTWDAWDDWLNNPAIRATYQKGREPRFRRWLVSHPDASAVSSMDLATTAAAGDLVEMITLPDDAVGRGKVEVPTVEVVGGRYAWWIAGENQKALITTEKSADDDFARMHSRSHWSRSDMKWLDGMSEAPDSEEAFQKSITLESYGLGEGDQALSREVRKRFHDLTTQSLGVLSNVRHGGLKKDLNLLLENDVLPDEFGTYRRSNAGGSIVSIRPPEGFLPATTYLENLNFTSWYKLQQYYQLYRGGGDEIAADSSPVPFQGAGIWGSKQAPNINFNWDRANLDYYGIGRTPIITRLMLVFSTRRVPSTSLPGTFDYKLGVNPVVVLWNPYNVKIHTPALRMQFVPGAMEYKAYVDDVVKVDWKQLKRASGPFALNVYLIDGQGQNAKPIVLGPGETRIFSAVSGFANSGNFLNVELYPGYQAPDADGGFEVDLDGLTGLPGESNVEMAMRFSDSRSSTANHFQIYWTVRNAFTGEDQRFQELAANPVEDGKPIYLAEDSGGKRVRFSNNSQRIPFANFQLVAKSGEDLRNPGTEYENDDFRSRNFIHANPVNQRSMYGEATKRMRGMSQYHVQIDTGSGNSVSPDFEFGSNRSYIGSAISLGGSQWPGQTRVVTNEFPLVPVTSMASLMHFKLNPGDTRDFNTGRHLWDVSANQALAIGNSFAHPLISGDANYQDVPDAAARGNALQMKLIRDFHDHAYLNNDALWDDWFFSGITREDQGLWQNGRTMSKLVADFENGISKLANPHLVPWKETLGANEKIETLLVTGSVPKEDAWKKASTYMMVRGAFNINSTSVDAWKAFFSGMQDENFNYIDITGNVKAASSPADKVLFSRFSLPASDAEGNDAGDPNSWLGVRLLTQKQIDRLARECVRQVKERGPFLNMSDFVNRRLADDETGVCGMLQAAIDWDEFLGRSPGTASDESINGRFKSGDDYITPADVSSWGLNFPLAAKGSRFAGIPGYLTQADVLKRIGNNITPRDDTFRIRAYGESRDSNGNIAARAWCEAVVQRIPTYLDSADAPELPFADLTSDLNKRFGRKMRIVSFRWLANNEI